MNSLIVLVILLVFSAVIASRMKADRRQKPKLRKRFREY